MSFQQAMQRYSELCTQYHAQQLNDEQFCAAVNQLRVQDNRGDWWQLSYQGHWLRWNGVEWISANPPNAEEGLQLNADTMRQAAGYAYSAYGAAQSMASGNTPAALRTVAGVLRPLAGKSERWWSIVSILGGGAAGGIWYWYSKLDNLPDSTTALTMLAVPVVLSVLRRPIDRLLAPLLPIRRKIPRLLLVGIGVAAPYFTAVFLYDSIRLTNYPYIRWTVFLGPLLSYMIIRTPNLPVTTGGAGNGFNQHQNYGANQLGRR